MRKQIARAFRWDFIGITLVSFSSFLVTIIGANFIGEDAMGQFAFITTILGYLILLVQLGYDPLIRRFYPRFKNRQNELYVFHQRLFSIRVVLTALLCAAFIYARTFHPDMMQKRLSLLWKYGDFLLVFFVLYSLIDYLQVYYVAAFKQHRLQAINIVTESIRLGLLVLLFYYPRLETILQIYSAIFGLRFVLLLLYFPLPLRTFFGRFSFGGILQNGIGNIVSSARLVTFSLVSYVQRWLIFIAGRDLDLLMIGMMMVISEGGELVFVYKFAFDLAEQCQSILLKGVSGGFSHSVVSEVYEENNRANLEKVYNGMFELFCLTTFPVAFGLAILSSDIVGILIPFPRFDFTHAYIIELTVIFSLVFPFIKFGGIAGTFFPATDNEGLMLRYRLFFASMNITGNLVLFYIFNLGIFSFVITTSVVAVLLFFTETVQLWRKLQLRFPIQRFFKFIIASGGMGLILYVYRDNFNMLPDTRGMMVVTLFGQIAAGAVLYALFILLLKPFSSATLDVMENLGLPGAETVSHLLRPRRDRK